MSGRVLRGGVKRVTLDAQVPGGLVQMTFDEDVTIQLDFTAFRHMVRYGSALDIDGWIEEELRQRGKAGD